MFCNRCGAQVMPGQTFCPQCGASVSELASGTTAVAAAATPVSRVQQHIQVLAVLWLIAGGLVVIPAIFVLTLGMTLPFSVSPDVPAGALLAGPLIATVVTIVLLILGLPSLLAGWGLWTRKPWARILAIVLAIIALFSFPFGTALGIYTLWVLASRGADDEYRAMAAAR